MKCILPKIIFHTHDRSGFEKVCRLETLTFYNINILADDVGACSFVRLRRLDVVWAMFDAREGNRAFVVHLAWLTHRRVRYTPENGQHSGYVYVHAYRNWQTRMVNALCSIDRFFH